MNAPAPTRTVTVQHAEIDLGCRWPRGLGTHTLYAAVATEMQRLLGKLYHAEWMGVDPDTGAPLNTPPVVRYRVTDGRALLHITGTRAHDHARVLLAGLRALRLPKEHVSCSPVARLLTTEGVGVHERRWWCYELRGPVWPTRHASARCPPASEHWAHSPWASAYLETTIGLLLESWGVEVPTRFALHVHVQDPRVQELRWHKTGEGPPKTRLGFSCTGFATNALLPDGIGIGSKTAFGFGEVRLVGTTGRI